MTGHKHIIRRQVIELEIPASLDSTAIQDDIARIYQERLVPLLDKYLDQKSPGPFINKIGQLELDLGRININNLEHSIMERMERQLRDKIPELSSPPDVTPGAEKGAGRSDLDLVVYFLQTGSFPWWAQKTTYLNFEMALGHALVKDPLSAKKILEDLLVDDLILTRFIYTSGDKILYRFIENYFPGKANIIKEMQAGFFVDSKMPLQQFRKKWWQAVIICCFDEKKNAANRAEEKIIELFTTYAGDEEKEQSFLHSFYSLTGSPEFLPDLLNQVSLFYSAAHTEQVKKYITQIHHSFSKIKTKGLSEELMVKELVLVDAYLIAIKALPRNAVNHADITAFKKYLDEVHQAVAILKEQRLKENQSQQKRKERTAPEKRYDPFSDSDKIYIQNAGLVLLWPFLNRFLENTGLANGKEFLDDAAAERACLLLQYLADGKPEEVFEAQLPLNKVLCGLDLEQPVNTQWSVSAEEMEAGENFLRAVIQHGPMWENLSVAGFRQGYLQREGALSTRDGNWLLQVKRETYDILIDRLPWTVQVVKLPWMTDLIFVEWQQT